MLSVTETGLKPALAFLKNLGAACQVIAKQKRLITSDVPWWHWLEEGFYRSGRPGRRRGGGAHMQRKGAQAAAQIAPSVIAAGLTKGPAGAQQAMDTVERKAVEVTQLYTPVRSGYTRGTVRALRSF